MTSLPLRQAPIQTISRPIGLFSDLRPYINYSNQRRTGFDFGVNIAKEVGDFGLGLGVNGMYNKTKNLRINETVEYDWLRQTGAAVDALRGYECLGFLLTRTMWPLQQKSTTTHVPATSNIRIRTATV